MGLLFIFRSCLLTFALKNCITSQRDSIGDVMP